MIGNRVLRDPTRLSDPARFDLTELTTAERMWLWRHRQIASFRMGRNGMVLSQREAAALLGIAPGVYNRLENGQRAHLDAAAVARLGCTVYPLTPTLSELCFIARRRSGETLLALADQCGQSHVSFLLGERDSPELLSKWWAETKGFKFPAASSN